MAGIIAYGAYIPLWRLDRQLVAKEWGGAAAPGEKSVGSFDEDSLTMGVAAAIDCLNGMDRSLVDSVLFATTTSPYKEHQAATTIATAVDCRRDVNTADFTDTLRAGTTALKMALDSVKAGSSKNVLVTVADCRVGAPRSEFEQLFGDGAAAFLVGDTDIAIDVLGSYSIASDIYDYWRPEGETYIRSWEDRFVFQKGYLSALREAALECMKRCGVEPKDIAKAAFYGPDPRRHMEMGRSLGLDPRSQVQDPMFANVGTTGAAHALMILVAALEDAKPGDKILLGGYGDGADVLILQVKDQIEKVRNRRGIKQHLASKMMIPEYSTYAQWRGVVEAAAASRRPAQAGPSPSALFREQGEVLRLHGVKCKTCGTVQYPPQRVCTKCTTKDNFEEVRLSDKKVTLYTYAMDYIAGTMDIPLVISVVNFEGGGRMVGMMTDRDINQIKVGMPLEMTFRQLRYTAGIHNYYWKPMPLRVQ